VYFPSQGEPLFDALRQYLDTLLPETVNRPTWHGLNVGDRISVRNWQLEAFATMHSVPSLGYRILETRTRLKPDLQSKTPAEIEELARSGVSVKEQFEHPVFAFTGDTGPGLDPDLFRSADVLFHECTFLDPEDRRGAFHATTADAFALATQSAWISCSRHLSTPLESSTRIEASATRCWQSRSHHLHSPGSSPAGIASISNRQATRAGCSSLCGAF